MRSTSDLAGSLLDLASRTLRRRWPAILNVWIVGSGLMIAWAFDHLPPTYRAVCLLRFDIDYWGCFGGPNSGNTLVERVASQVRLLAPGSPSSNVDLDRKLMSQVLVLTSAEVLTAAANGPQVAALPRIQDASDGPSELRQAVTVNVIPGTYLIEVACASRSPEEAATLVNAVVDAYMKAREGLKADPMAAVEVRPVSRAVPPGRPLRDVRPFALVVIASVWLALTFALFAGVEAWSGPEGKPGFEV